MICPTSPPKYTIFDPSPCSGPPGGVCEPFLYEGGKLKVYIYMSGVGEVGSVFIFPGERALELNGCLLTF